MLKKKNQIVVIKYDAFFVHKGGKIKNWGGECREQRCHTYKIAVSKYQGRCEQRSEFFVKTFFFFFFFFFWGGGGGGQVGGGGRGWGVTGWM